MPIAYRAIAALTSLLLFPVPLRAASAHRPRANPAAHRQPAAAAEFSTALYSRRALRRARIILQMKLWELKSARLERVEKALKRHIPLDELLKMP